MSRTTLGVFVALALAFAAITGLAVQRGILGSAPDPSGIGGPFTLVDQRGQTIDQKVLKGKWSVVFFGFTFCPEACPTTLFALGETEKQLKAKDFQTVFVSIDPARDTPAKIATYLSNTAFPRQAVGLTGTTDQVAAAARAYRVYYQKAGEGADYTINHSTITYLMSPKGRFVCAIPYGAPPEVMTRMIKAAMARGAGAQSCMA